MGWKIVPQEETIGREKREVVCKHVKCFPIEGKGGDMSFGRLKFLLLQVLVEDEQGYRLALKFNASQGVQHATFVVQHPKRLEYPMMVVGEGKRRRKIVDTLSPKVEVPGEKEQYTQEAFVRRIERMFGAELANVIITAFVKRLGEVASK